MADQVFKLPKQPKEPPLFRINAFKGINLNSQIDENQSPDMLNMNLDDRGELNKRTGFEKALGATLGPGKINGLYTFRRKDKNTVLLIAHGTNIYQYDGVNPIVSLDSNFSGNPVNFFAMGDKCYIQDGASLFVYDSPTVTKVINNNPYVPTLTISRPPAGGGEPYEDFNLIGTGFKDSFSGDGTSTEYQLSLTDLNSDPVSAEVDGTLIREGFGLTVNRTTGKVTFTTAPKGGTNNVIITAYKTVADFPNRIQKCTLNVPFGGANDGRIFVGGNPDYPNKIWRSGIDDPTYWPENGFYKIGNDNEAVTGFAKQYDYMVIEKEFSKWNMSFTLVDGRASFPIKPINDQVGTIAKKSIQIIENNPVSLDRKGVYMLTASQIRDERNIQHLSSNVDKWLLRESNLENAISIDFNKKYWLALNGKVYVYDYQIKEWYIYDNIHASSFAVFNGDLYFGSSIDGMVYRFKKETHLKPYNDDGKAINAYWDSKMLDFNVPERYKIINRIFYSMKPNDHTSCKLYVRTDKKGISLADLKRGDKLNFLLFDFTRFSFKASDVQQEMSKKLKEKKVTHFQIRLENNELDESLGVTSLGIKWNTQNEVK